MRSHLWLRAAWLGQCNEHTLLWLRLEEGLGLAFRLPGDAFGDDQTIGALVAQVADDLRSTFWRSPRPRACPGATPHRGRRTLDQEVLRLLAGLNRHRV